MKVTIKEVNEKNIDEVRAFVEKKGLKPFHSLPFQWKIIPAGEYEIDTNYIFDNQYNTVGKNGHSGYRIFEYSCVLSKYNCKPRALGYYISSGIDEIRELQSRVKKCNYCGKQYKDTKQKYCLSCIGSEYLEEKDFHLLRLTNISEKYSNKPLPKYMVNKIAKAQKRAALKREKKAIAKRLSDLKQDIKNSKMKHDFILQLINVGFTSKGLDNLIYYNHNNKFCFGWREKLTFEQEQSIKNKVAKIKNIESYNIEYKTQ